MIYEIDVATFQQPFVARVLSHHELSAELERAGLRLLRQLTPTWAVAALISSDDERRGQIGRSLARVSPGKNRRRLRGEQSMHDEARAAHRQQGLTYLSPGLQAYAFKESVYRSPELLPDGSHESDLSAFPKHSAAPREGSGDDLSADGIRLALELSL